MSSLRWTWGIVFSGLVVACSSSSGTSPVDSGKDVVTRHDARTDSPDTGTKTDAPHDAGVDARRDTGASHDAGVGTTCGALLGCDALCTTDACTNACYAKATGVAQGLFNAFSSCVTAACADSDASSCDQTAATGTCSAGLEACEQDMFKGPPDPDGGSVVAVILDAGPLYNCGQLIACVAGCSGDAGSCAASCGIEATAEARALQGVLNACLVMACPSADAGPCSVPNSSACSGCIEEAELALPDTCATQFTSCQSDRSNAPDASTSPTSLEEAGTLATVVSGILQPGSTILVQDGYLYYAQVADGNSVKRVPLTDGGTAATLGPPQPTPVALAIDSNNVYVWSVGSFSGTSSLNNSDGQVVQVPLGGGAAITLTQNMEVEYDSPYINSIAVDATHVYWIEGANGADGKIMRATIGMQDAASIYTGQLIPEAIATDGTNVYWASWGTFDAQGHSNNDGTISQGPVSGGTPKILASNLSAPSTMTIDAQNVYWGNLGALGGDNLPSPETGAVMQVPIGGGTVTTLASAQAIPIGIAVSGGTVYWAQYGFSVPGLIMSARSGGGSVVPLVAGLDDPFAVTISGNTIYWTNTPSSNGSGTILSLSPL